MLSTYNLENILFFKDIKREYGTEILNKIISKFTITTINEKDNVYQIGERDNKIYLLLKGKLATFMELQPESIQKIYEIKPITSFGEIAVYSKYSKRFQTIIALQNSTIAYLERYQYKRIIAKLRTDSTEAKIQALIKLGCFESWTLGQYKKFSFYLHIVKFVYNEVVYKEGENSDFIYLIKEGQFQMSKQYREQQQRQKIICLLNEGQLFGEECFMENIQEDLKIQFPQQYESAQRYFTIKCNCSIGVVYRIRKIDILERGWDELTKKGLIQIFESVRKFRMERSHKLQQPILQEIQIEETQESPKSKLIALTTYRNIKYFRVEGDRKVQRKIQCQLPLLLEEINIVQAPKLAIQTQSNRNSARIYQNILKRLNSKESEQELNNYTSVRKIDRNKIKCRPALRKQVSYDCADNSYRNQNIISNYRKKSNNLSLQTMEDEDVINEIYEHKQFLISQNKRKKKVSN